MSRYKIPDWIPDGRLGDWAVERFDVTKMDAALGMFQFGARVPDPGRYTRLTYKGHVVMSDTPAEIRDHLCFMVTASGRVLIGGLGLGVVTLGCLQKKTRSVEHVTIIERSPEVIELVGRPILERFGRRVAIVQADVFKHSFPKGTKFDGAWMDVWGDISIDELAEMATLRRRYGRFVQGGAKNIGCWRREYLLDQRRRERDAPWNW